MQSECCARIVLRGCLLARSVAGERFRLGLLLQGTESNGIAKFYDWRDGMLPVGSGASGQYIERSSGEFYCGGFAMAHGSLAESHGAMGCERNAGDYAKGRRIMMPADACSRRIFGRWAEVMGSECVAQTEMSDAAFGDNAMDADFAEVELADGLD